MSEKPRIKKKQKTFAFEPEYVESDGVKHEFNGTLFVPTAEEMKRIDAVVAERDARPTVALGEQHLFVPSHMAPQRARGVKMKLRDALRFRTKG